MSLEKMKDVLVWIFNPVIQIGYATSKNLTGTKGKGTDISYNKLCHPVLQILLPNIPS